MLGGRMVWASIAACATLVMAGCAGAGSSQGGARGGDWPVVVPTAPVEVSTLATVLEQDGVPMLCLGAVAESYPPQCSGPPIDGWDWAAVEGEETASGVTWGVYAVRGNWDGERLSVTREPILGALYDPMADPSAPNPWDESLPAGPLPESEAVALQSELSEALPTVLTSAPVNGRLVVEVVYDDGSLQEEADARYGDDAVVVISRLTPVDEGRPGR